MKFFMKKVILIFMKLFNQNLKVDLKSEISPNTYKNMNGKKNQKIIIKNSVIGGSVCLGHKVFLKDVICSGKIKIGNHVSITGPATRISGWDEGVQIGSYTSIASNVVVQEEMHRMDKVSTYLMNKNLFNNNIKNQKDTYTKGKIIIEEDVWIGSNSVILSGVTVGRGSVIGAGTIVSKSIPRYSIVVGNPARVIKKRFNDEIIWKLEEMEWWNYPVEKIQQNQAFFTDILTSHISENIKGL